MIARSMLTFIALLALFPQETSSVWDSVYSRAQADRGRTVYEARCSRCHGSDLQGVNGSALAGEGFMLHWEGRTIERLWRRIHDTMPPDSGGTMTDREAVDIVAYVLQRNGFPDGSSELAAESATLATIQIKSRAGPAVVRNGALVQSTGCLDETESGGWLLTNATEPEITALDTQSSPAPGGGRLRGTRTIPVLNVFPNPAAHKGHTMRAKGFLIRAPSGDRINIVTLEMIASRCDR